MGARVWKERVEEYYWVAGFFSIAPARAGFWCSMDFLALLGWGYWFREWEKFEIKRNNKDLLVRLIFIKFQRWVPEFATWSATKLRKKYIDFTLCLY